MEKVLISACLLGERVRHDGRDATEAHHLLRSWRSEGRLIALCPEVAGGLPVPRPAAEIFNGDSAVVLAGMNRVLDEHGHDVTAAFVRGAEAALQIVQAQRIRVAILKDGSPSCGSSRVYDGTFAGVRITGSGITAALLERHGVRVFTETRVEEAARWLERLETATPEHT